MKYQAVSFSRKSSACGLYLYSIKGKFCWRKNIGKLAEALLFRSCSQQSIKQISSEEKAKMKKRLMRVERARGGAAA